VSDVANAFLPLLLLLAWVAREVDLDSFKVVALPVPAFNSSEKACEAAFGALLVNDFTPSGLPGNSKALEISWTSLESTAKRTIAVTLSNKAEEMAIKECLEIRVDEFCRFPADTSSISCAGSSTT
jgi:hypothetical protein